MPQVRMNYDAGFEYGRNTQPEYGLYYVGVADAHQQFVVLARRWVPPAPDARTAPPLRSLASEIQNVHRDRLSLYERRAWFVSVPSRGRASDSWQVALMLARM